MVKPRASVATSGVVQTPTLSQKDAAKVGIPLQASEFTFCSSRLNIVLV
jgi:hypothetical protein